MSLFSLVFDRLVHGARALIRRVYWFFNLSKARQGRFQTLDWPVICEGHGNIVLGAGASLGKLSELSAGKNSTMEIGPNATIRSGAVLKTGFDVHARIGKDFKLEQNARLFIQQNWVIGDQVQIATDCALFSRESPAAGILSIGSGTHIGDHTIIDLSLIHI